MSSKLCLLAFCLMLKAYTGQATAQELRCQVTVNSNQMAQVDRSIFDGMEVGIREFMNNTQWTNDRYEDFERIECQIFINVVKQEASSGGQVIPNRYSGTITVIAQRRIFNSTFDAPLLNHQDNDFTFTYAPNQQFLYSENAAQANLTSILAYYAYLIIGLDMDSFAPKGGEEPLLKAQAVVNNGQNLPETGWRASEGNNNRYWIINDYLNQAFSPLRDLIYEYHRKGFDYMVGDMKKGRLGALQALEKLDQVWDQRPNAFLLQVFYNAKRNEIINLLKNTPAPEKAGIIPILKKTDPAQASKYDAVAR